MMEVLDIYRRLQASPTQKLFDEFVRGAIGDSRNLFTELLRQQREDESILTLLGFCHSLGIGTLQDEEIAKGYYDKAVALGSHMAMLFLAIYHYDPGNMDPHPNEANRLRAIDLYTMSAQLGNSVAMYNLAKILDDDSADGDRTSMEWYRKSAEAGHPDGMRHMAIRSEDGTHGVAKDPRTAIHWWSRLELIQPDPENRFRVGKLLESLGDRFEALRTYHRIKLDYPSWPYPSGSSALRIGALFMDPDFQDQMLKIIFRAEEVEAENQVLRGRVEVLETDLAYRPGGPGYEEALQDFTLSVSKS